MCVYVCGLKVSTHPDVMYVAHPLENPPPLPLSRMLSRCCACVADALFAYWKHQSWYKSKYSSDVDAALMNTGNTASSYGEQRLFLASGCDRSTRLLGGATFGGANQVYAHKHGDSKAEMHF